jgi:hypothetical protein
LEQVLRSVSKIQCGFDLHWVVFSHEGAKDREECRVLNGIVNNEHRILKAEVNARAKKLSARENDYSHLSCAAFYTKAGRREGPRRMQNGISNNEQGILKVEVKARAKKL